jgi:hypothetical protein
MWYSHVVNGLSVSDSIGYVGGVYGGFTRYAIGFDEINSLTYNVREI